MTFDMTLNFSSIVKLEKVIYKSNLIFTLMLMAHLHASSVSRIFNF